MKMNLKLPLFCILLLGITSCKERNEDYPPVPWDKYFNNIAGIAPRPVSAILALNDHSEWYGSQDSKGLVHFDGFHWQEYSRNITGIPIDSVTALLADGNGLLWVAYKNGLATFDGYTWKNIPELSGLKVTSLALQGIGIIWAGLDGNVPSGGLARFRQGNWDFLNTLNSGIASSHTGCVLVDLDQNIWAASTDKGISRFNGRDWFFENSETLPILSNNFTTLAKDPKGTVWAGTATSELVRFDSNPVVFNTGTGKPITTLLSSGNGKIWMGTAGAGVVTFDGISWDSYTPWTDRLPGDTVISMTLHPDGKVLASFSNGNIIHFIK